MDRTTQILRRPLLRLALMMLALLTAVAAADARGYSPADVPNPNVSDYRNFVADPGGLLRPATVAAINSRLKQLRDSTTVEMTVAIVPSIGDYEPEEFAEQLFTSWGVGNKDNDNGLLLLISPDSRVARIQTGYGVEGVVTDVESAVVMREDIVPAMREGDLDAAALKAVRRLARILSDPEYASELRSKRAQGISGIGTLSPADRDEIVNALCGMACIMFVVSAVMYFIWWRRSRGLVPYAKATLWRSSRLWFWILALLSAGSGVLFALLAEWRYRHARNGSRRCPDCRHKMRKLGEKEDNAYLSRAQDMEERLGSVDYDVWRCPECDHTDVLAFPQTGTPYQVCPHCGTRAWHHVGDRTIVPSTTRQEGSGVHTWRCEYCGHGEDRPYRIPRRPDPAVAAVAAAAALGAASRRSGGGGGGFGGGFGGGSTGGGGATGRW